VTASSPRNRKFRVKPEVDSHAPLTGDVIEEADDFQPSVDPWPGDEELGHTGTFNFKLGAVSLCKPGQKSPPCAMEAIDWPT
jgi:hypothetical protein